VLEGSAAAALQVKSTGPELLPAELRARNPEQLFLCSARSSRRNSDSAHPTRGRRSQNPNNSSGLLQPEDNPNILARSPGASTQKGSNPKARPRKPEQNLDASSPKARLPNPKVPASTPARGFMAVYRSLRYLLLYLPLHLTLVLRSSFYAPPYAETLQAFQALAPDPFVLRPRA